MPEHEPFRRQRKTTSYTSGCLLFKKIIEYLILLLNGCNKNIDKKVILTSSFRNANIQRKILIFYLKY